VGRLWLSGTCGTTTSATGSGGSECLCTRDAIGGNVFWCPGVLSVDVPSDGASLLMSGESKLGLGWTESIPEA